MEKEPFFKTLRYKSISLSGVDVLPFLQIGKPCLITSNQALKIMGFLRWEIQGNGLTPDEVILLRVERKLAGSLFQRLSKLLPSSGYPMGSYFAMPVNSLLKNR